MKKNALLLIVLSSVLSLSACGLFNKSSNKSSSSSSVNEPSISSNVDSSSSSEASSSNSETSQSSSISSNSSSSSTSSSSNSSSDISSSSSSSSSSASSSASSSSSNSYSSESNSSSSSESSSSSPSSSNSSSIKPSSSSSDPIIEPELIPQHASATYSDFYKNHIYALSTTPSTGEANILVVPIWFTDSTNYIKEANKDNVKEDIHTAYFGTNEETGWRSVKTYYEQESHGALTLNGTVSDWYECGYSASDCYSDSNVATLKQNAVEWYFTNNPSEDRKSYDSDHLLYC